MLGNCSKTAKAKTSVLPASDFGIKPINLMRDIPFCDLMKVQSNESTF